MGTTGLRARDFSVISMQREDGALRSFGSDEANFFSCQLFKLGVTIPPAGQIPRPHSAAPNLRPGPVTRAGSGYCRVLAYSSDWTNELGPFYQDYKFVARTKLADLIYGIGRPGPVERLYKSVGLKEELDILSWTPLTL